MVSFSLHIPVPVPDSIVLFCLGKWDGNESLEATLSYKDESVTLGKFTAFSRFVQANFWRFRHVVADCCMKVAQKAPAAFCATSIQQSATICPW